MSEEMRSDAGLVLRVLRVKGPRLVGDNFQERKLEPNLQKTQRMTEDFGGE